MPHQYLNFRRCRAIIALSSSQVWHQMVQYIIFSRKNRLASMPHLTRAELHDASINCLQIARLFRFHFYPANRMLRRRLPLRTSFHFVVKSKKPASLDQVNKSRRCWSSSRSGRKKTNLFSSCETVYFESLH